jgi:hypothetical protein
VLGTNLRAGAKRMKTSKAFRDVLAIPEARALIGASAASQTGDWMYNAALLGYVFVTTKSASWVAAATICRLLPYVPDVLLDRPPEPFDLAPQTLGAALSAPVAVEVQERKVVSVPANSELACIRARTSSGSSYSDAAVNPTRSQNS